MKNFRENLMHMVFFLCALTSIFAVVLICIFLFANGVPAMREIGLLDFLTGAKWKPGNDIYGILADDPRQPVHHRRCDRYRRADRSADGGIHVILLSEKAVRSAQAVHRTAGRYSVHRIRLLRHGHYRTGSSCGGRCVRSRIFPARIHPGGVLLLGIMFCRPLSACPKRRCVRFR